MRILVVTTRWDLVGGSERYAGAVVRGLCDRGFLVRVLTGGGHQESSAEVLISAELAAPGLNREGAGALRETVRAAAPDVIYLLSRVSADHLRILLGIAPLVRFVQDHTLFCPGLNKLHEDASACSSPLGQVCLERYFSTGCSGFKPEGSPSLRWPLKTLAANLRELELSGQAKLILVASDYMRRELLRAGLSPARLRVLPYFTNSIAMPAHDSPTLAALPAETAEFLAADDAPLLLTPARLTLPDKGLDYLLTALGQLERRAKLVIAGDGPARDHLQNKARAEGLSSRVHFSGWLAPAELESLLCAASLVLFPSIWNEPFGLVGLEAMAHAKPVVAFDVGGVREWLIPGETGLLCPARDAAAFSRAMAELLDDPHQAQTMGARGQAHLKANFSRERHLALLGEWLSG